MFNPVLTISRFTFYEAMRNRLIGMMVVGLICILGLTEFIGELAITETQQIQSALMGAGLRLFVVCVIGLFVITSMVREFNDKGFEVILSLPMPRSSYYFGKFLGFFYLSIIISLAASSILLVYSQPVSVLFWFFSLNCELLIVISLSLLCLFTFSNITVAFVAVMSFYLLARSMSVIQLISDSPILEAHTFSQDFINFIIDAIAVILPKLHIFTKSEWLIYGVDYSDLLAVMSQTIIYLVILLSAGLFDLYRKDL